MANLINIGGGAGGSSGGGHTILDNGGTSLTQRTELQFKGAYSEDNSTDEVTEVNVIRSMTKAEFDLLSNDEKAGIINVTDESGSADRNYSETTLWSGSETSTSGGAIITLSDDITNYDDIIFVAHANNSSDVGFARFNVSLLTVGSTYLQDVYDPNLFTIFWGLDSSTQIKWYSATQQRAIIVTEIIGIKYGNGTQTFHNYSTTEHIVGTWIDGSTIYEKTISTGAFTLDNITTMHTILTDSNIGLIISVTGSVIEAGIIYNVPESGLRIKYNTPNLIAEKYAGSWVITEGYVTIRYTKSSS